MNDAPSEKDKLMKESDNFVTFKNSFRCNVPRCSVISKSTEVVSLGSVEGVVDECNSLRTCYRSAYAKTPLEVINFSWRVRCTGWSNVHKTSTSFWVHSTEAQTVGAVLKLSWSLQMHTCLYILFETSSTQRPVSKRRLCCYNVSLQNRTAQHSTQHPSYLYTLRLHLFYSSTRNSKNMEMGETCSIHGR
jgi:hypothetical protein